MPSNCLIRFRIVHKRRFILFYNTKLYSARVRFAVIQRKLKANYTWRMRIFVCFPAKVITTAFVTRQNGLRCCAVVALESTCNCFYLSPWFMRARAYDSFLERYRNTQYSDNPKKSSSNERRPCCPKWIISTENETTFVSFAMKHFSLRSQTSLFAYRFRISQSFVAICWAIELVCVAIAALHCYYIYRCKIHFAFESLSRRLYLWRRRNSYLCSAEYWTLRLKRMLFRKNRRKKFCFSCVFDSVFCSYSSLISMYRRYIHSHWCLL